MSFDDVLDLPAALAGSVEIDLNVSLRIDDGCNTLGSHKIGGVRQTSQKEMLDFNCGHGYLQPTATSSRPAILDGFLRFAPKEPPQLFCEAWVHSCSRFPAHRNCSGI